HSRFATLGRLPHAGGATALLRRHDARPPRAVLHERAGLWRYARTEGEPVRTRGAGPAQRRCAAVQGEGRGGDRAVRAAVRAGHRRPAADRRLRGVADQSQAGRRLSDLPAEVPLCALAARADPSPSHRRLWQHDSLGVEFYLKRRVEGNYTSLKDVLAEYDRKWLNQGFLTWEHQEARKAAGREALTRFWHQEEAEGLKPTWVEKDFAFSVGNNRVRGRFDRVDEDLLGAVIVDYKTSEVTRQKDADRRVGENLQLKMYSLAWREMTGRLPQRVELRFIETHVTGRRDPTEADLN